MINYAIPFNKASFVGNENAYIAEALTAGHISGDGAFTAKCSQFLESALGAPRVMLTTSCTHALELSALLLDLQPGDEVIIPSFTFVSTANAFALHGGRPVFADIRHDTLNIDPAQLSSLVTDRTSAIVVVHYAGIGCDMEPILLLAKERGIPVIEDNAHGLFGRWQDRNLGTFGRFAALSFHETKNFTCGEGGALVLNDRQDVERAEIIREKGTNRARFFRGQVDRYTWVDIGSSYLPSEVLAAILCAQLEQRDAIQARRMQIWERYGDDLAPWAAERGVLLPQPPPGAEHSGHLFYMLLADGVTRGRLIQHLAERSILAVFHYQPLHLSPMGLRYGGRPGACPVTEDVSQRLLRLPIYYSLTDHEQGRVIEALLEFAA